MNNKTRQIITLAFIIGMVAMSIIAQLSDFGGQSVDDTSNRITTLLNPAPYAFGIWGLIYLGLLGFGIYQVLPAQRDNPRLQRASSWIIVNAIANMLWYPAAYQKSWDGITSNLLLIIMLYSLVKISQALQIRQVIVSTGETWLARLPFSLYFGWVTVATPVSIANLLAYNGWNGGSTAPDIWAVIILAVGLIIAFYTYLRVANFAYLLVIAWGYVAIAVEQASISREVAWAALVGAVLAVVIDIAAYFAKSRTRVIAEHG